MSEKQVEYSKERRYGGIKKEIMDNDIRNRDLDLVSVSKTSQSGLHRLD